MLPASRVLGSFASVRWSEMLRVPFGMHTLQQAITLYRTLPLHWNHTVEPHQDVSHLRPAPALLREICGPVLHEALQARVVMLLINFHEL